MLIKNTNGFDHSKVLKVKSFGPRLFLSFFLSIILASCVGGLTPGSGDESARTSGATSSGAFNNSVDSIKDPNYGRIMEDNPIIVKGKNFSPSGNLNEIIDNSTYFITDQYTLTNPCRLYTNPSEENFVSATQSQFECYRVFKERENTPIFSPGNSRKWAFDANSSNFLQVHTMGHMNFAMDNYFRLVHNLDQKNFQFFDFNDSSMPILAGFPVYWKYPGQDVINNADLLNVFSEGLGTDGTPLIDNAKYDPSNFSLVFGRDLIHPKLKYAQDPSVIYHEAGHAITDLLINIRNNTQGGTRSALNTRFYEEGGALSEGIADYYSYVLNNREQFAEWAFGRDVGYDRPLSEASNSHRVTSIFPGIGGELSYPEYLNYDAANPNERLEDIHYAGQIITHFMVALTKDFQAKCHGQYNKRTLDSAQMTVLTIMGESLAELGDLTARGRDSSAAYGSNFEDREFRVNLNPDFAIDWQRMVNPINYRRFTQMMANKIYTYVLDKESGNSTFYCPLGNYQKDDLESLLDRYGLLLFDTYNTDGNSNLRSIANISGSTPLGHNDTPVKINLANRIKTELINKENLILNPNSGEPSAFVFDGRSNMTAILDALNVTPRDLIPAQLDYNNGNGQVSPGEFLGILPNIYNNSNSTMGGIQILGNDWDHFKDGKPCNNLGDNFPFPSEGAADLSVGEGTPGACNYVTRQNGVDAGEDVHPVCFLQTDNNGALIWASQEVLAEKIGLDTSQCLDPNDPSSCFIETVKGFEHSWMSRIDPNKSYAESLLNSEGKNQFLQSNLIFMQVNPNTPPGTKFNCRFRARFTNCQDCWHDNDFDGDDFLDFEFSGSKPFKIINLQFRVID